MVHYLSAVKNNTNTLLTNQRVFAAPSFLKKFRLPILIIIGIAIVVALGIWAQQGVGGKPSAQINQNFSIQARTEEKIRVTDANLGVTLTDAEIDNTLLVQGKRATTREGKTFLILNMEVENPFQVPLYIFPVDLLRLVREDGKRIAPSVHQGTVEVRPLSAKKSNVGFVIEPDERDFRVEFGELTGEKETLEIAFK